MVVVGNGNGVLGWGQGKAAEVNEAVQKVRLFEQPISCNCRPTAATPQQCWLLAASAAQPSAACTMPQLVPPCSHCRAATTPHD